MTKQCGTCVSRLERGNVCVGCSLNIDKHLKENVVCGSYEKGEPIDDFQFEFGNYDGIDDVNEKWLEGKEV